MSDLHQQPDTDDLLVAVAALGGDQIDRELAAPALAARRGALDAISAMRAVPLPLIDAIEPGHAPQRLMSWQRSPQS